MNPSGVEQGAQVAADGLQQMPQEGRPLFPLNVVLVELAVAAARADGDAGNGREPVVPIPMVEEGPLSHRRPGFRPRGDQEEAAFIGEDERGGQPRGVFFIRGQTVCFQRAMAFSSLSMARRSGFWWLQPAGWSSLPT